MSRGNREGSIRIAERTYRRHSRTCLSSKIYCAEDGVVGGGPRLLTRSINPWALSGFFKFFCKNSFWISSSLSPLSRNSSIMWSVVFWCHCRRLSFSEFNVSALASLIDPAESSLCGKGISKSPRTIREGPHKVSSVYSRSKSNSGDLVFSVGPSS